MRRHNALLLSMWLGVLFLLRFTNFDQTLYSSCRSYALFLVWTTRLVWISNWITLMYLFLSAVFPKPSRGEQLSSKGSQWGQAEGTGKSQNSPKYWDCWERGGLLLSCTLSHINYRQKLRGQDVIAVLRFSSTGLQGGRHCLETDLSELQSRGEICDTLPNKNALHFLRCK